MKHTRTSYPKQTSRQSGRYSEKRSVTETLLEALSQTGLRPTFKQPARARKNRFGQVALGFGMLIAVAALGFVFFRATENAGPVAANPIAVMEIAHGSVWRSPAVLPAATRPESTRMLTLAGGEPILAGTLIEPAAAVDGRATTSGIAPGRAALRLAGGQSMRLDAGTRVRVASSSDLVLERGAIYVDSRGESSVEVRTTLGVVRDIGTQFEVRLTGGTEDPSALRVRVREGAVLLEHGQESIHAMAGEELGLDKGGHLTRASVPIYGPQWDWVLETAPAPDIAGQSLDVFLDWLSREGGWQVQFADQQTAQLASTTILHGDIHDLTPTEASAMVLHSSGLDYRLEGDQFLVEPKIEPTSRNP